ncbi:MAG TPA: hypothetical protein VE959_22060 [Bryobacteraceae bacterium]|nr:hypothetical protein [Bryobacteraceae bacterium]
MSNESWGCGGNFTPEDYATEFRRFTAWTPSHGVRLAIVGSGPNAGDLNWTRGFFSKAGGSLDHMWAGRYATTRGTHRAGAPPSGTRANATR